METDHGLLSDHVAEIDCSRAKSVGQLALASVELRKACSRSVLLFQINAAASVDSVFVLIGWYEW
ncbi:hypothetical protein Mapa_001084 [Marchantia paleacea]|nr:hypothetical protein Mapa_001084 [Marchantia paleacea]